MDDARRGCSHAGPLLRDGCGCGASRAPRAGPAVCELAAVLAAALLLCTLAGCWGHSSKGKGTGWMYFRKTLVTGCIKIQSIERESNLWTEEGALLSCAWAPVHAPGRGLAIAGINLGGTAGPVASGDSTLKNIRAILVDSI